MRLPPSSFSYEASLALALLTGVRPNFCYANVWHLFHEPEVFGKTLSESFLVEGWLVWEQAAVVAVIEHCWCESQGVLLDPSIVLLASRSQSLFYFPGIRRAQAEIEQVACEALPLVRSQGCYGIDGLEHADYQAAYQAAYGQAQRLAAAHPDPKPVVVRSAADSPQPSPSMNLVVKMVSSHDFSRVVSQSPTEESDAAR